MNKSDHTKLQILARLAEYASVEGLSALTYGTAAEAAHLSRGALQRYFSTREQMLVAVLDHTMTMLHTTVFLISRTPEETRAKWFRWLDGRGALSGGCVLVATASQQSVSDDPDTPNDAVAVTIKAHIATVLHALAEWCCAGDLDAAWRLYGEGLAHRQRIRLGLA